jgi:hypothetical protein
MFMCIICHGALVVASALASVVPGVAKIESNIERIRLDRASQVIETTPRIIDNKCKKIGAFRSAKGVKFQCVNSKKGLRWLKVSKPNTAINPSMTTTTTTTTPTVRSVVHSDIIKRSALARSRPSTAVLEFRIAPSISDDRAKQLREKILWAFLPWESQTTGAGPRVIVIDENGEDFWRANMPAGGGNCPGAPGTPKYVPPSRNGFGGFGCWNENGDHVLYMAIGSGVNEWPSNFLHHEVTHLAQAAIYGSRPRNTNQPCFLGEGEATLYGNVLGDGLTGGELGHQQGRRVSREIASKYALSSDSDWLAFLKVREIRDQTCSLEYFNYYMGYLYMEKLYYDFGVERISSWKSQLPDRDWRDPFRQVFGINPSEWYSTSLIPYIREMCSC